MVIKPALKTKPISGSMKFFMLMLLVYLIVGIVKFSVIEAALLDFLGMLARILPILVVVMLFMVITNLLFTRARTEKYLGAKAGFKGWAFAVISGVIVSGPPYILFPMLAQLKRRGMSEALLAVFLYNRNVKIPFLPVMAFYFGLKFTVVISVYIILFSVFSGWVIGRFGGESGRVVD